MDISADKLLEEAIRDGIRKGIADKFGGYHSPLDDLMKFAIEKHQVAFRTMLEDAIGSCVNDELFRAEVAAATRTSLAKTLVQRFGGELEKQVNALKSDPSTRARITLAIDEIVKSRAS